MNSASFAAEGRRRKVACLVAQADRMKNDAGANDDDMIDFLTGLTDAEWNQLMADAQSFCIHGVTHSMPGAGTKSEVIDAFFTRSYRAPQTKRAVQERLAARLNRRHLEIVR